MKERRRFIRVPESSEITYRVVSLARIDYFVTKNLSREGARFFVHEFIPIGTILRIKIKLKKTYFSFEALAQVRWVEEDLLNERFEIGVKFIDIPRNTAKYLDEYLDSLLKIKKNRHLFC
ncbi:MAG: PilZ domain-containing protein [Candidatus Omnitrophota bacterium]